MYTHVILICIVANMTLYLYINNHLTIDVYSSTEQIQYASQHLYVLYGHTHMACFPRISHIQARTQARRSVHELSNSVDPQSSARLRLYCARRMMLVVEMYVRPCITVIYVYVYVCIYIYIYLYLFILLYITANAV